MNSTARQTFRLNSEWLWLFEHALKWEEILAVYPKDVNLKNTQEAQVYFKEVLEAVGQWCQDKIAPRALALDQQGAGIVKDGKTYANPLLEELYKEAVELNFFSLVTGREFGGLNLPIALNMIAFSFIGRACLASSSQLNFFPSMIDMLERFCDKEDAQRLIPKIIKGEISGSMGLTEASAGSDIGSLTTMAKRLPDGTFSLSGNKIFISNGGGGFSFVLARTEGAADGIKGISLFLVEQFLEDKQGLDQKLNYQVIKDEKKMGMKGSFTCQVVFENSVGKLVGEENKGLLLMFHLMNMSRIGAGAQALGIMEASLDYVKKYAIDRKQFGVSLLELPLYKRNFNQWSVECDAYRALLVDSLNSFTVYHGLDLKKRKSGTLTKDEQKILDEALVTVRLRTPLVKYYGTEIAVEISKKSIQALGGHGIMLDHAVERLHRDSFGPLLYEGTSQIQALMVFKDLMKNIIKHPGDYFGPLFTGPTAMVSLVGQDTHLREYLKLDRQFKRQLAKLFLKTMRPDELLKIFEKDMWLEQSRIDKFTIHAESICQSLAYLETLKVLADHARLQNSRSKLMYDYLKIIHPRLMAIFDDWRQW